MPFCPKCGVQVAENEKFCNACGAPLNTAEESKFSAESIKQLNNTADTTAEFDPADIEKTKRISLLSYLGLLFLIPMLVHQDSRFARYHVNQGIVLFLFGLICNVACTVVGWIPLIGWIVSLAIGIIELVLMIIGIVNAVNGRAKELPVIGRFKLLH